MEKGKAERIALTSGWLAHQPPAFQAAVLGQARRASFAKDETVLHAGTRAASMASFRGASPCSCPAAARRCGSATSGAPGFWFGHWPVMTGRRAVLTFRAAEPTVALHVSFSALNEIARQDGAWARSVGSLMDFTIDLALTAVGDLLIPDSDRRLAATMLRAAGLDQDQRPSKPIGLRLTPSELGEMANVAGPVASRILARFEAAGWVVLDHDQLAIANPRALAAFAAEGA